jgi:hypothetical protein
VRLGREQGPQLAQAASLAVHGKPTAPGHGGCARGGATTSFIGDSCTCNYPGDRRGTSVRARPDDGRRTGGPRSGARPASEGPPRGVRDLQWQPRGAQCLGKARGLGWRAARMPRRRMARGRSGTLERGRRRGLPDFFRTGIV